MIIDLVACIVRAHAQVCQPLLQGARGHPDEGWNAAPQMTGRPGAMEITLSFQHRPTNEDSVPNLRVPGPSIANERRATPICPLGPLGNLLKVGIESRQPCCALSRF